MSHTLSELLELQKEFDQQYKGNHPFYEVITSNNIDGLEHLLVCIAGEVGELANVIKKIRRGDFNLEQAMDHLTEETVDVFIYLLKISNQLNIDLEDAFFKKRETNRIKFLGYKSEHI